MASDSSLLNVLIAGGGVAGIEAALALRELAAERVSVTILASGSEFIYRPMTVREPFAYDAAQRYPLERIATDTGATLVQDSFKWLDPDRRLVHTGAGRQLSYDALVLALGAKLRPRFRHAITLDDSRLDEQLHGLFQDVEGGNARKLAFLIPKPMPWPLPAYELALMTARRAFDTNAEISITLVTPEDAPLAVFGTAVSEVVQRLLEDQRILVITSAESDTPAPGRVTIRPGMRSLQVDRIVALPQLFGVPTPGVPKSTASGFISIDAHCRVIGLERVYAAGDATDFPVKFGGIAAQQADTAAEHIAALAGAPVQPHEFEATVHAILLGGEEPLYLSARLAGTHGTASTISTTPTWSPAVKISARYLAPYLESQAGGR